MKNSMRGIETDGPTIAALRAALQLTQEQLCAKAQCDVKTMRAAEHGKRVDLSTLKRLAAALNVPAASIVRPPEPAEALAEIQMDVARRWQQAFNERNIDGMLACYHDHAVLDFPAAGAVPGAGTYEGKEGLRRQAEITFATFDTQWITADKLRLHAAENYVFMRGIGTATVRSTGMQFTALAMHEFEFEGDKIVRHLAYFDTAALEKAVNHDEEESSERPETSR